MKKHKPKPLTKEEIQKLKDLLYVAFDEAGITRRGKLSYFNVRVANKKWKSFAEAENEVHLLYNEFFVKKQNRSNDKEPENKGKKIDLDKQK